VSECATIRKARVTDRALRYRANQPACKPAGPRRCAECGARSQLMVDHADGHEENGRRSNLRWLCRSCNTRLGAMMAKTGKGRRTKQYNPATLKKVSFTVDKHGRPIAYRESGPGIGGYRLFRIGLDEARALISTGQAREVPFRTAAGGRGNPSTLERLLASQYDVSLLAAPAYAVLWAAEKLSKSAGVAVARRELAAANRKREKAGRVPAYPPYESALFDRRRSNPATRRNLTKQGGAANVAEYILAALDHTRGAHDAGGLIIHNTPKSKRREYASLIWANRARSARAANPIKTTLNGAPVTVSVGRGGALRIKGVK